MNAPLSYRIHPSVTGNITTRITAIGARLARDVAARQARSAAADAITLGLARAALARIRAARTA